MTQTPTPEDIKVSLIESLDETYDLVFVDHGDNLTDSQIAAIVGNDIDSLNDSIWEWESESAAIGARSAALEAVTEYERSHIVPEDFDISETAFEIEEPILNRNSSDPVKELASRTSDAFLRVEVISEDAGFSNWTPKPAKAYLSEIGLPTTEKNITTMTDLIAETPSDLHMAYVVFTATMNDLVSTMGTDSTATVENPEIVLGNPFTGGYWNATFEGALKVKRTDLVTDASAFGWSVEETYGGFITDSTATFTFEAEEGDETA